MKHKLHNAFMHLAGHEVIVNGTLEFVETFIDDNAETDTLAGALIVEDRKNAGHLEDLAHSGVVNGRNVNVTYGYNAERIVEDVGAVAPPKVEKVPEVKAPKVEAKPTKAIPKK